MLTKALVFLAVVSTIKECSAYNIRAERDTDAHDDEVSSYIGPLRLNVENQEYNKQHTLELLQDLRDIISEEETEQGSSGIEATFRKRTIRPFVRREEIELKKRHIYDMLQQIWQQFLDYYNMLLNETTTTPQTVETTNSTTTENISTTGAENINQAVSENQKETDNSPTTETNALTGTPTSGSSTPQQQPLAPNEVNEGTILSTSTVASDWTDEETSFEYDDFTGNPLF